MNIGLLGFGVVGRGVYDMLAGRDDIRAAWVLCRRDLGELTARTTYEMQDILDDPAVDTVVEVMGGLHPAYEYVAAALRAGKNVVSSNKYLMCRYYDELTALAKEHGAALITGALTDTMVLPLLRSGVLRNCRLVVKDPSKVLLTADTLDKLASRQVTLETEEAARTLCITVNPVSAYGWKFDKDDFLHRMREAVDVPVINVKEELA